MPTPFQLVLGVAVLVGLGVLFVYGRRLIGTWLRYRETRVVVCPDNRKVVAVQVDAAHAALSAPQGRPELRLEECTRWPEKAGCGQECLSQIESSPDGCRVRTILADWYRDRECALCRPHVRRDPLARPQARPDGLERDVPGVGRLPPRADHGRPAGPRAGLLGLPPGGELPARSPRAGHRAPRAPRPPSLDGLRLSARRPPRRAVGGRSRPRAPSTLLADPHRLHRAHGVPAESTSSTACPHSRRRSRVSGENPLRS